MRQNLAVAYQTYLQIYSHKDNETQVQGHMGVMIAGKTLHAVKH